MSRNDYISDDLITMRDRLRESTTALREAAEEKRNRPSETAKGSVPAPAAAPSAENAAVRRQADGVRAKQDLAGRIARDRARIGKLLEQTEARRAELRQAQDALAALDQALTRLSPLDPGGQFAAETDRLRLEYFRLCGTLDTLAPAAEREANRKNDAADRTSGAALKQAAWIVGLAVLAAAGVIAGVIAAIFR